DGRLGNSLLVAETRRRRRARQRRRARRQVRLHGNRPGLDRRRPLGGIAENGRGIIAEPLSIRPTDPLVPIHVGGLLTWQIELVLSRSDLRGAADARVGGPVVLGVDNSWRNTQNGESGGAQGHGNSAGARARLCHAATLNPGTYHIYE